VAAHQWLDFAAFGHWLLPATTATWPKP